MSDLRRCVELAAPIVLCAFLFFPDEHARWLAIGIATAVAFAAALQSGFSPVYALVLGVIAVRWIPLHDVIVWRELVVFAGIGMVFVSLLDDSPLAVAASIAVAVVTPVVPLRGLAYPFAVAFATLLPLPFRIGISIACIAGVPFARYSFAPMLVVAAIALALPMIRRVPLVPQVAAVGLLALWPWSGLLARSFPAFLRATPAPKHQEEVRAALRWSESVSVDVPAGTRTVIVTASGANAAKLWPKSPFGRIDVTDSRGRHVVREFTVADTPDFGFMRRDQFFASHNRPAREPVADIRGFGATSFLYGAGRIRIDAPGGIASVRVTADPGWKREAKLQVESIGE